jgi:hypothetical protein
MTLFVNQMSKPQNLGTKNDRVHKKVPTQNQKAQCVSLHQFKLMKPLAFLTLRQIQLTNFSILADQLTSSIRLDMAQQLTYLCMQCSSNAICLFDESKISIGTHFAVFRAVSST